jgi:sulfur carrier protein
MEIILNGISYRTDSENIFGLINEKGLNPSTVVVEYNGKVLKKEFWKEQSIAENDRIEILNFVGGG